MKLLSCPICGNSPIIESESLDKGNGQGYPGKYFYYIVCPNKCCPLSRWIFSMNDIYRPKEKVIEYLHNQWNRKAKIIDELIAHRKDQES